MRDYQPSGRVAVLRMIAAFILMFIVAVALGIVAYIISLQVYFIPASPLILAAVAGLLARGVVRLGHVRNAWVGFGIGLLIGLTAYFSFRAAEYFDAMRQVAGITSIKDFAGLILQLERANVQLFRVLVQEVGQGGVAGFLEFAAQQGIEITRGVASSATAITLDRTATYVYWLIEFVLTLLISAFMGRGAARGLYCENGRRWLADRDFQPIGVVPEHQVRSFEQALRASDFRTASGLLYRGVGDGVQIWSVRCGDDTNDPTDDMIVRGMQMIRRNRRQVFVGMMGLAAYSALMQVQPPPAPAYGQPPPPAGTSNLPFSFD